MQAHVFLPVFNAWPFPSDLLWVGVAYLCTAPTVLCVQNLGSHAIRSILGASVFAVVHIVYATYSADMSCERHLNSFDASWSCICGIFCLLLFMLLVALR